MKRALTLLATALLACGCGGTDEEAALGAPPRYRIPGCEKFETSPCDVRDSACETRLFGLAACLRGDEVGQLPPVTLMTEGEYADYLGTLPSAQDPDPSLDEFERAFVLLGLVVPGAFTVESATSAAVEHLAGVYRDETKDIVIIDHGADTDPESSSVTLLHELVHALQDQESDLGAFEQGFAPTYDAGFAARAVVEGEARFHETRFSAALQGLDPRRVDWRRTFQDRLERNEQWMLEQDSPLLAARYVFPYEWGARSTSFSWEATGHDGVLARFGSPPTTTHAYVASIDEELADDFTPTPIDAPTPPADWMALGQDELGSLGVLLEAGTLTDVDHARELALAWRGDELSIYASTADVAVVWSLELADTPAAADFAALLAQRLGVPNVRVVGTRVVAAGSYGSSVAWALPASPP